MKRARHRTATPVPPAAAPPAGEQVGLARRRPIGFNALTALALGVGGYALGHWVGSRIAIGMDSQTATDQDDIAIFMGFVFAVAGWLLGLGFLSYPLSRMAGRPPALREKEDEGPGRYFRLCTDHKVIGMQYFVTVLFFFLIAGLNGMFIRAELLTPNESLWNAGQYLSLVGLHGTMMLIMMSAAVLGPFGNYFVPIMIGARRMAFPRLEALSFWLVPPAGLILLSAVAFGGFPTGWTGYAPLANEARGGMDAYIFAFALIGISMTIVGVNMLATVLTMRAPGLTWDRMPIFVWGVLCTSVLMVLAAPVLFSTLAMATLDRTVDTSFFLASAGGSPFLFDNLWWFFGHPEVYILALPGFGIVLEILPVFSRKPLWGYRLAVAGMVGVTLLSFMVWQHHLFVSGMNSDLRPFYMLTTELISIPTGFIFLNGMGTLWRGRIRFTVPMLFSLAFFSNFLIGGLSGFFLSDVPSDVTTHGSYFVMAHFHYTILGGLVFAFFAGIYYWLPKMTGLSFNERLAKLHFWGMFVFFNLTFAPLFAAGLLGMPRRVSTYAPRLQGLNDFVSISAFLLGLSMLVFVVNLVYSMVIARVPAESNPWHSRGLEFQVPTPVPVKNFEQTPLIQSGPYEYGVPDAPPVAALSPPARVAPAAGGG
ncbi:MAG: cytochrome c oxidase subunit [Solirubrobacteraceae bacterium]|jgi:cytochrome c oxidase subunit 1|nr:cytochrome c oxidase subunit [Solirubrobacteraceae bacterium]